MDHAMMHHDMAGMDGHAGHDMSMHEVHQGHGSMDMCRMAMVWNTDTKGICVVFKSWHVRTERQMLVSCMLVCLFSFAYEWLKLTLRRVDEAVAHTEAVHNGTLLYRGSDDVPTRTRSGPRRVMPLVLDDALEGDVSKHSLILRVMPRTLQTPARLRMVSTVLYGAQVSLSCFLMLVMMTYNAWLLGALVIGAMIGASYTRHARTAIGESGAVCH